jgi:HK97 family phage prohead protease
MEEPIKMKNEKDYIEKLSDQAERRAISGRVERREIEGDIMPEIHGVACVFEQETDMGWYIEKVARGAFEGCEMSDVVALMNHDTDDLLSRTTGRPDDLVLSITNEGLEYTFRAKNECSKEVAENIALGFIKGSSFAFRASGEAWDYDVVQADGSKKDVRTITKFEKLFDVSPVTFAAYPQTSVALRSRDISKPKQPTGQELKEKFKLEIKQSK